MTRAGKIKGYAQYAGVRRRKCDKTVDKLDAVRAEALRVKFGLNVGDVLWCGGVQHSFARFGGIDDGNPWIVAYKMQVNGKYQVDPVRLCVWRRSKGGAIEPQSMVDGGAGCYETKKEVV